MVRLDGCRRPLNRDRFNHVGIQGALNQKLDIPTRCALLQLLGLRRKHVDELFADNLPLPLGVSYPRKLLEEMLRSIDPTDVPSEQLALHFERMLELAFPHHP